MIDARDAALDTLMEIAESGAGVQAVLDRKLRQYFFTSKDNARSKDAALTTELVYGVLRREVQCRWLLKRKLSDPNRLPDDVLCLLFVATYALLFLKRVPPYATVDHAVGYVRAKYNQKLAGLVNGVLRNLGRELELYKDISFYRSECSSDVEALALFYSMPLWIAQLWHKAYAPDKFLALLQYSASSPITSLRINAALPDAQELRDKFVIEGGRPAGAFGVSAGSDVLAKFPLTELLQSGRVARQSAGSQEVIQALNPASWPGPIWDVCCGYGGKTMLLLEQNFPLVLASDLNSSRLYGLLAQTKKRGFAKVQILRADVMALPAKSFSGTILLDAPCSGLGGLAGRPDIKRNRTMDDVRHLIKLQAKMLQSCFNLLEPGGRLAYITCTRNPQENEMQIASFLKNNKAARLLTEWESSVDDGVDGMYGALMKKERGGK